MQKRISTKTESSEASKIFIRGKKEYSTCRETNGGLRERENRRVTPSWQLELLLWVVSSGFPLASHCDLPGSQPIFGVFQDSPGFAHASLTHTKRHMGRASLDIIPF